MHVIDDGGETHRSLGGSNDDRGEGKRGEGDPSSPSALTVWVMDHHDAAAAGRRRDAPDERHTTDRQRGVAATAAMEVCDGIRG